MIYKIAGIGFLLFVAAVCYTCAVISGMADEEQEEMLRDLWKKLEEEEEGNHCESDKRE